MKDKFQSIRISLKTRDQLQKLFMNFNDTYNKIITRLIEEQAELNNLKNRKSSDKYKVECLIENISIARMNDSEKVEELITEIKKIHNIEKTVNKM